MNLHRWIEWFERNQTVLLGSTAASVACAILTVLFLPDLAAKIPRDYFKPGFKSPFRMDHPVLGWVVWFGRNLAGVIMMAAGAAMVVLPGPGMPVLLMGLLVSTLPARRSLLRMALRRRPILAGFNWLRRKRGAPPFLLSDLARRTGRKTVVPDLV